MQNIHWLRPKICVLALVFCFSSHILIPDLSDTLGGSQCKTSSHLFYTPVCFHSYCYIPCWHHFQIPDCNPLLGVFICTLLPLLSIFHTALKIIFFKITLIHALHLLRTLSWFFFEIWNKNQTPFQGLRYIAYSGFHISIGSCPSPTQRRAPFTIFFFIIQL